MMKTFVSFLLGGILGFAGGAVAMLIFFPFLFPPPMVNEQASDFGSYGAPIISTSIRQNVDGHDPAHWGRGDIKVYDAEDGGYLIELQSNFEVGPGPNFWLYLNKEPDIDDERDFKNDRERVRVTKLKSFQGSQVYKVSQEQWDGTEAISIWCESFDQYIASANVPEES